jgi:ATP-dependent Clp protease ATP-binding subunit ClpC
LAKSTASVDLPLSNASKRILAYTAEEANKLASQPIGTEHLVLGLLREKKSDVPAALAAVGINLHSARNRIPQERNLALLERKGERESTVRKLRPFDAFMPVILVLLLIYVIFRLVNK